MLNPLLYETPPLDLEDEVAITDIHAIREELAVLTYILHMATQPDFKLDAHTLRL